MPQVLCVHIHKKNNCSAGPDFREGFLCWEEILNHEYAIFPMHKLDIEYNSRTVLSR